MEDFWFCHFSFDFCGGICGNFRKLCNVRRKLCYKVWEHLTRQVSMFHRKYAPYLAKHRYITIGLQLPVTLHTAYGNSILSATPNARTVLQWPDINDNECVLVVWRMPSMKHRYRLCEMCQNLVAKFAAAVAKFARISTNSTAKVKWKVAKSSTIEVFEIAW